MRFFLITAALVFSFQLSYGQGKAICDSPNAPKGTVKVYADPRLNQYIFPEELPDAKTPALQGFRIQIYSGTDRNEANKRKMQFLQTYPDEPAYLDYQAPNFRVRVGDYRNKMEAQKLFHEMKEAQGGGVLIVPDKINFPELKP